MTQAETLIFLPLVLVAVSVLARRLKTPPAILLVLTGVVLALVPGLPAVNLAPEFMLLVVLPPLIYSSAVAMSWREFKYNLRPISMLAVGCVAFTTSAVALAAHGLIGLPWAEGFVLGAIVSPPDAVAPLALARKMQLPRRILLILEGEGLANDATALVLYRFAVAAVSVGVFSASHALTTFAAIAAGEVIWGLIVGWLMLRLRNWVHEPRLEILLSVLTPYIAYWPPQHLGGSGVLATVVTGLYISWNGLRLISAPTRLQGIFFWDFLIFSTEGLIFLVTGLQARAVVAGFSSYAWKDLMIGSVVVSAVVIVSRFVWMYPATYVPRWLFAGIRKKDPAPPWQWTFVLGYTGIRGVVSLAAALALPLTTDAGLAFPHRELILFFTFVVILVTLVGQGLLLPSVIEALGLANAGQRELQSERVDELAARRKAIEAAVRRLDALREERDLPAAVLGPLHSFHADRLQQLEYGGSANTENQQIVSTHCDVAALLLAAERDAINELYRDGALQDEPRRRIERDLDLRHAQISNATSL